MNRLTLNKVDKATTELERKAKRLAKKAKLYAVLIGILLTLVMIMLAFYNVSRWFDDNKVNFYVPVKFIQPVVITKREIKSPIPSKEQVKVYEENKAKSQREAMVERLYQKTRQLESNFGFDQADMTATHIYCQNIGKVNEIGYFYKGDRHFCFENEAGQRKEFTYWLTNRIDKGYTLNEAFC